MTFLQLFSSGCLPKALIYSRIFWGFVHLRSKQKYLIYRAFLYVRFHLQGLLQIYKIIVLVDKLSSIYSLPLSIVNLTGDVLKILKPCCVAIAKHPKQFDFLRFSDRKCLDPG